MAVYAVGDGLGKTSTSSFETEKIYYSGYRLFHEVDRGRTFSIYHRGIYHQILQKFYNLPLRHSKVFGHRQWIAIRESGPSRAMREIQHNPKIHFGLSPPSQRPGGECKPNHPGWVEEAPRRSQGKLAGCLTHSSLGVSHNTQNYYRRNPFFSVLRDRSCHPD